jgi:hypothetical protein
MNYKLPPNLLSWAWTSRLIRSREDDFEQTAGGLLIPRVDEIDDTPAIAHFSEMSPEGTEFSWLWLFETKDEALRLRLLQQFQGRVETRDANLIQDTLPKPPPGEPEACYLQDVPLKWLSGILPQTPDIKEVWVGFDFKRYVSDRKLRFSTQVFPTEEFLAISSR